MSDSVEGPRVGLDTVSANKTMGDSTRERLRPTRRSMY